MCLHGYLTCAGISGAQWAIDNLNKCRKVLSVKCCQNKQEKVHTLQAIKQPCAHRQCKGHQGHCQLKAQAMSQSFIYRFFCRVQCYSLLLLLITPFPSGQGSLRSSRPTVSHFELKLFIHQTFQLAPSSPIPTTKSTVSVLSVFLRKRYRNQ